MINLNKIYNSNSYGKFIILKYIDSYNVKIKFLNTNYQTIVKASNIKNGYVKDKFHPTVCNIGYLGGKVNDRRCYNIWNGIMKRCYNEKTQNYQPTYIDTIVCKEWYNYQNFEIWYKANYIKGWHLDKDLLTTNKEYSPENCIFVPININNLLTGCNFIEKEEKYKLGVSLHRNTFYMQCNNGFGKQIQIKCKSENEAHILYYETKANIIKQMTIKFISDYEHIFNKKHYLLIEKLYQIANDLKFKSIQQKGKQNEIRRINK